MSLTTNFGDCVYIITMVETSTERNYFAKTLLKKHVTINEEGKLLKNFLPYARATDVCCYLKSRNVALL